MKYELKIALKFLFFNKKQTFFLLSAISMGVAVQLFISSLIVSLQKDLINSVLGNTPHIILEEGDIRNKIIKNNNSSYILGNFSVERNRIGNYLSIIKNLDNEFNFKTIVPTLNENGIYKRQGKSLPINIIGIKLENANSIYNITNRIYEGKSNLYSNNIIIGRGIQREFSLKIGDPLNLTLADGIIQQLKIVGVVDLENQQSNNSFVFIDLNKAQQLFNKKGYVSNINLQLSNVFDAPNITKLLEKKYKDLKITPWTKDGQSLLLALKAQTSSSIVIQIVVMLATSLSIISVLFITVIQKSKEIGILKAMGATDKSSGLIFVYEGGIIGFIGSILGVFLGSFIIAIYMIGVKPPFIIEIENIKVFLIIIISTIAGVISAYFPAKKCMTLNAIEVIKGE